MGKQSLPANIQEKIEQKHLVILSLQKEFPKFFSNYFMYIASNTSESTQIVYMSDLKVFLLWRFDKSLFHITKKDLESLSATDINTYLHYCRYQRNNARSTISRKRSSLLSFLKAAYREGLLKKDLSSGINPVKVPAIEDRDILMLTEDEVKRTLECISHSAGLSHKQAIYWEKTKKRDKVIFLLFVTYGLRISELQQLNVSSFNFTRGEFKIYRKRGKESIMPLNSSLIQIIQDYINNERILILKSKSEDAMFLSLRGERLHERSIRNLVKKYTALGMNAEEGYSPHKLRATTATTLIARGKSLYDIQELLDHSLITTTQIYAAHRKNSRKELVNELNWYDEC